MQSSRVSTTGNWEDTMRTRLIGAPKDNAFENDVSIALMVPGTAMD